MPGASVDVGTGASVVFATSGFAAEIVGIRRAAIERPVIETSHLGTAAPSGDAYGNATKIPGRIVNPGQLELDIHYDIRQKPPIHAAPETITLNLPTVAGDSTAGNESASGFVASVSREIPLDGKMTATITIEFTGPVTPTDPT